MKATQHLRAREHAHPRTLRQKYTKSETERMLRHVRQLFLMVFAWKITENAWNVRKSNKLSCHLVMTPKGCGKKLGPFDGAENQKKLGSFEGCRKKPHSNV
jgi:hypothetical protein